MADEPVSGNMWDAFAGGAAPKPRAVEEPPPVDSEDAYGANVVALPPRKRAREGWRKDWHVSATAAPLPTLYNALVALRNHEPFVTAIRFDEMACQVVITGRLPGTEDAPTPRVVRDADVLAIQEEMQVIGLRRIARATVQDAIERRAEEQRFHPVKENLLSLEWDGEKRILGWLSRYLGVEGSPYADMIGRLFLIALVAFAARNGFLLRAVSGLVATYFSIYRTLRKSIGLTRYTEDEVTALLKEHGLTGARAYPNIGHNQRRMLFLAKRGESGVEAAARAEVKPTSTV